MGMSRWLAGIASTALGLGLVVAGGGPASAAERPDSLGKEFWVGFTQNYFGTPELSLFISGPTATNGTVEVPGIGFSDNFTVTPGSVTTVSIPATAQMSLGNSGDPESRGIHVTAKDEVAVYGLNRIQFTTDAFAALPVDVLETEHLVLGWTAPNLPSEFAVVAAQDGTEVTYVPTADTVSGVTAGTSVTKTLNKGEALPVAASSSDLSGTPITSNKPVAVFGGNQCANIPNPSTAYCDYVVEQIPGTSTWGKDFVTVPLKTRKNGDTFRFVAAQDGTDISLNGAPLVTLNRGQVHQQIVDGASTVSANKPILVSQYSNGTQYDGVTSDPFMMLVTPTEQFLSGYTFTTPASGFAQNYVNVVVPTSAVGQVTLDGAAVPSGQFTAIGSSGLSGAQLDLGLGSHTMTSPEPFGIGVYGFNQDDSYGYPGGAAFAAINDVTSLSLTPPNQQADLNTQVCLDATVRDQNGQPLPGITVDLQRTGPNPGSDSGLTNGSGVVTTCYTGAAAGTDTVTAKTAALTATATVDWGTVKPARAKKKLPIRVKKGGSTSLGADDRVVLTKKISTNKHGKLRIRVACRPIAPSAAGEVRFCDADVNRAGRVVVRSTGYDALRVTVRVKATPKKGSRDTWRANSWRKSWRVTG